MKIDLSPGEPKPTTIDDLNGGGTFMMGGDAWIATDCPDPADGNEWQVVRLRDGALSSRPIDTLITPFPLKAVPDVEGQS